MHGNPIIVLQFSRIRSMMMTRLLFLLTIVFFLSCPLQGEPVRKSKPNLL